MKKEAVIPASDTVYLQDYKQIMYDVTGDKVCFYISATEDSNPHNITGKSTSSESCVLHY